MTILQNASISVIKEHLNFGLTIDSQSFEFFLHHFFALFEKFKLET